MPAQAARETDVNMAVAYPYPNEPGTARWLVLGASGFIGRNAVAELKHQGRAVVGVSRSDQPEVDILDGASLCGLMRKLKPDILLNACGHGSPGAIDPVSFYAHGTRAVLEAVALEVPACRVVLLGSAAEYGNTE